eukprot:1063005-Rhodomonas_salina.1
MLREVSKEKRVLRDTKEPKCNLGWQFLLALQEMEGIELIASMSALTIPLMFDFMHQQWPMIGCSPWPPVGRKALVMWPTLTQTERGEVEATPVEAASEWMLLTWRKFKLPQSMLSGWKLASSLMQGHTISRQKDWWETGNPVATKITDHLDLWSRTPRHSETLRRAMKRAESAGVRRQLAWATIHDEVCLEHYFSMGQAAHLRGAEGTVLCTDGSVHLDVLENGHTKASLWAGIAYREGDGQGEG